MKFLQIMPLKNLQVTEIDLMLLYSAQVFPSILNAGES